MSHRTQSSLGSRLAPSLAGFSLLVLASCSGLLGIEDLHEGPAPGSAGSGANAGTAANGGSDDGPGGAADAGSDNAEGGFSGTSGGALNPGGGSHSGGQSANQGGASQGGASQGGASQGGASRGGASQGGAGQGAGGAGASGGTAGSVTQAGTGGGGAAGGPVHGHVTDYWGHKLAGVPVEIGGTQVTTDDVGAFSIDHVAAEYDVSLVVQYPDNYDGQVYGWVYQGLTRRDPTLQVYSGLKQQTGNLDIATPNATTTLTGTRTMTIALGGPDGSDEFDGAAPNGYDGRSVHWRGAAAPQETAHALIWQPDAAGLPTGYVAYDSKLVALDGLSSTHSMVTLNMSTSTIASGNIVGTVSASGTGSRTNSFFLQFNSNAVIRLSSDNGPNSFSYLVPTIANSSITFAASEGVGSAGDGAYAIVHKDALAAGTSGIAVTVPKPATLLAVTPASAKTKVNASTQFSFQAGAGSAGLFLIAFNQSDLGALKTNGLYVVTSKKSFVLPKVVNDTFALDPGAKYHFRVETHGSVATADAAAGPAGFLDSFSGDYYGRGPLGPRRSDGSYTISAYSDEITIAP